MQQSKQEDTSQMNYAADFEMEEASFEGQNFIAETNESSLNRTSETPISLLQNNTSPVLKCPYISTAI